MTGKQWIDFLVKEWNVSRACAEEMLQALVKIQKINQLVDTYNSQPFNYADTDALFIRKENDDV